MILKPCVDDHVLLFTHSDPGIISESNRLIMEHMLWGKWEANEGRGDILSGLVVKALHL